MVMCTAKVASSIDLAMSLQFDPDVLANYTFELVKEFSSYYNDYPVLREENAEIRNFRVALIGKIGEVVKMSMGLLGVDMVERM